MKIFYRYVVKEHATPFIFAFAVIMFILILKLMLQVMELLISKGVAFGIIMEYFAYNLAWMVALVVPMSVLVASVMAFGRLGSSGEIIAMKAAGVSMYRVVAPIIILASLLTAGMIWFNNVILPEANYRAGTLKGAIRKMKPTMIIEGKEGQFINERGLPFTFRVDRIDKEKDEILGVTLFKQVKGEPELTVVAERGEFLTENNRIELLLFNGEIHRKDQNDPELYAQSTFDRLQYTVRDLSYGLDTNYRSAKNDRNMTSYLMREHNKELALQIKSYEQRLERLSDNDTEHDARVAAMHAQIKLINKKISKNLVEIHKKNSIPFAALVFVLIGSSLGILVRRSGASIGMGLSIGFFTLYYLFLIGGESMGDRLILAPWLAMWLPNIILGPLGIAMFIYAARR